MCVTKESKIAGVRKVLMGKIRTRLDDLQSKALCLYPVL